MKEVWNLFYNGRVAQIFQDNGRHKFFLDNVELVEYDEINRVIFDTNGDHYALEVRDNGKEFICLDGIEYPAYKAVDCTVFSPYGTNFAYRAMKDNGKYCVVINGKESKEYDNVLNLFYNPAGILFYCAAINGIWRAVLHDREDDLDGITFVASLY